MIVTRIYQVAAKVPDVVFGTVSEVSGEVYLEFV